MPKNSSIANVEAPASEIIEAADLNVDTIEAPASEAADLTVDTLEETEVRKPTVKKTVTASARVAGIKAATLVLAPIEALYITYKEWNGGNSFVVKLPSIPEVVKSLDHSMESKQAIAILRELRKSVATLTKGDASQTWVFHESGAFALYSRMDG